MRVTTLAPPSWTWSQSASPTRSPRGVELDAYLALGVRQVWLVDWREQVVEVCTGPGSIRSVRDRVEWLVPGVNVSVTIALAEIFAGDLMT